MTELEQKIIDANIEYRKGTPIMEDKAYDSMLIELGQVYPESELLKKGVIEEKPKTRMEKLPHPMFSLDKLVSMEEIEKWFESNHFSYSEVIVITPKYDAISLIVEESTAKAWTRGDGIEGQVSDKHFRTTGGAKRSFDIFTSGEMIMPKEYFDENVSFFSKQDPPYSNPRNMAAGLFNADDYENKDLLGFQYIRYNVFGENLNKANQLSICNKLNQEPITFVEMTFGELFNKGEDYLTSLYKQWKDDPFEIDGLVIDINDVELRKELGREKNNNPKYSRAIKLGWEEEVITTVKGIEWSVSKEGLMKPVILIESTSLSGVIVKRVAGYNAAYIFDNNIAKGSRILIKRSGEVIPKHLKTVSYRSNDIWVLKQNIVTCPSCGSFLHWVTNDDGRKVDLQCQGNTCEEMEVMKLVHFFNVMDIDNFGEPSIRKLYGYGYKRVQDILQMDIPDFDEIDGFGDKSSSSLLREFENKIKEISWIKLGHALSVFEGLGTKKLILFTEVFDEGYDIDDLKWVYTFSESSRSPLESIKGLSTKTVDSFFKGVYKLILKIKIFESIGVKITYPLKEKEEVKEGQFKGEVYVFTGFRDKDLEQFIIDNGGKIASGISKNVTHLVVKDMNSTSSKVKKAKELGLIILPKKAVIIF